ncbi:MAG: hypothetical protein ACTSQE_12340 [Candidatus Heimdallarchaeaceae archaeon]
MTLSISPAGRDFNFTFSFKNSCNSRCCRTKITDSVYVNKKAQVEPFRRITRLVTNTQAEHAKSFTRMQEAIKTIFKDRDLDPNIALKIIEETAKISFQQEIKNRQRLTLEKVNRINDALEEYYECSSTPKTPQTPQEIEAIPFSNNKITP